MYIIILLIIAAVHQCGSNHCNKYFDIIIPHSHFDRIDVKKDGTKIGHFPYTGDIWEIYSVRMIGHKVTKKLLQIIFKPSSENNSGHYELILIKGAHHETIFKHNITHPWSGISQRHSKSSYTITKKDFYYCGSDAQHTDTHTIWYLWSYNKLYLIYRTNNNIQKRLIGIFTKVYCEAFYSCKASDILYTNGTKEKLTWDTDFRPVKILPKPTPATVKPIPANTPRGGGV